MFKERVVQPQREGVESWIILAKFLQEVKVLSIPLNLGGPVACFDQQNIEEVKPH